MRALWESGEPDTPPTPPDTTPDTTPIFTHFDEDELRTVRGRVTDAGLVTSEALDALTSGIHPNVVDALPAAGPPPVRLLGALDKLNRIKGLRDGTVPLATWLRNAAELSAGSEHEDFFVAAAKRARGTDRLVPELDEGPTQTDDATLESLEAKIGPRDVTVEATFLTRGAAVAASVAKILVPRVFDGAEQSDDTVSGTAWVVAPTLALTNHHVINARDSSVEEDASDDDFAAQAAGSSLEFGYYSLDAEPEVVAVTGVEASDRERDFALLRLQTPRAPLKLRTDAYIQSAGTTLSRRVNLLQHPNGEPMRLGFRDNFIVSGDDRWLTYLTDTDVGSSGSPVCNDDWEVVALHRGSRLLEGVSVELHGNKITNENYGVQVAAILSHLESNPTTKPLFDEIIAAQQEA